MRNAFRHHAQWGARSWLRLAATVVALAAAGCNADLLSRPTPPPEASLSRLGNWGHRGRLVDATLIRTIDRATAAQTITQFGAQSAFQARYDVQQWTMSYTTVGVEGEAVTASAAVFLPIGAEGPLPLVSFSHGTVTEKNNVPSNPSSPTTHGVINATHGSVTVLADYIGLGIDAAHDHPYLHAGSGASASLDALRAARKLVERQGLSLDGRLFVYGYSQGGQVAMALVREIEQRESSGFTVTAAAPMSGPYDLYGSAKIILSDPAPFPLNSINIIYAVAAYQQIYGIAERLDQLLKPPYDGVGQRLISDGIPQAELLPLVPQVARDALQPDILQTVLTDPDAPLSHALRANDLYDWRPRTPLRLYYGTADRQVPYQNALTAEARMRELGASDVQAVNLGPLTHGTAQWPAFIAARKWFDTFPVPSVSSDSEDEQDEQDEPDHARSLSAELSDRAPRW